MIVQCEKCQTKFRIPTDKLSDAGSKVRCSRCAHIFVVRPEAPVLHPITNPFGPPPNPAEETVGVLEPSLPGKIDAASDLFGPPPPAEPPSLGMAPDPRAGSIPPPLPPSLSVPEEKSLDMPFFPPPSTGDIPFSSPGAPAAPAGKGDLPDLFADIPGGQSEDDPFGDFDRASDFPDDLTEVTAPPIAPLVAPPVASPIAPASVAFDPDPIPIDAPEELDSAASQPLVPFDFGAEPIDSGSLGQDPVLEPMRTEYRVMRSRSVTSKNSGRHSFRVPWSAMLGVLLGLVLSGVMVAGLAPGLLARVGLNPFEIELWVLPGAHPEARVLKSVLTSYQTENGGEIMVVAGLVENGAEELWPKVTAVALAVDDGQIVKRFSAPLGLTLNEEALFGLTSEKELKEVQKRVLEETKNDSSLRPGEVRPFMILAADVPEEAKRLGLRVEFITED